MISQISEFISSLQKVLDDNPNLDALVKHYIANAIEDLEYAKHYYHLEYENDFQK